MNVGQLKLVGRARSALGRLRSTLFGHHKAPQRGRKKLRSQEKKLRSHIKMLLTEINGLKERLSAVEAPKMLRSEIDVLRDRLSAVEALTTLPARLYSLERLLIEQEARAVEGSGPSLEGLSSPIVSIIMPTRNRRATIVDAVESVRTQRFRDWELIIVDDGSSDATELALARFQDDNRIRYIRQAAQGAAHARNAGLALARGSLVAYLDSDNLFFPNFLLAAVKTLLQDRTTDLVYGALVTEFHNLTDTQLLWEPFDRERLLQRNSIDLNAVVHRKTLFDTLGGFDENLDRLSDWDLILRYTEATPPQSLPALAARYRVMDRQRITDCKAAGPSYLQIRRKWHRVPAARPPRVLYVLWHYPQLSEGYIEAEIRCMLRWGAHVEVWAETDVASPYPASVPIHRGPLSEAIANVAPDILHVHWLNSALQYREAIDAFDLPVTIRLHGFDFTHESLAAALLWQRVRAIYGFPQHAAVDSRLRVVPSAFDTELFKPRADKDRRLVVRTSAGLPSKDLGQFFELAKKLPEHRFVLAAVTCKDREPYIDELKEEWRRSATPAELRIDVPRDEIVSLVGSAGIYLHTARIQGEDYATPIGMPISIAEAMATGAYLLVRNAGPLKSYVGEAGAWYRDADHAAELIRATASWSDDDWFKAWRNSVDRAFMIHADELALRPIFEDWVAIVGERDAGGSRRDLVDDQAGAP